ncbi:fungal specific transcription factor domain-containing protein [Colletotrichum truncatum]|uniref:Fungal specific transcription factor domain-containing protein n=1 Tax=Colletotrichum truncatum TaxID=5467 RepID=A0ACC3ZGS9_COLTU
MSFFIGYTQHHIDTREFSDRLAFFYANIDDPSQTQTPWYLEMLLVFAVGKLFSGSFDSDERTELPGWSIFTYVQTRLPSLSELYSLGKLGIEIHALAAVYLQNANRKEEAYLYISSALRLATTHGYHRKLGTKHLLQSEKVHLNRLWWTVYMQERRLAAATGNPSGILDDVIEIDMPIDSPGFPPALPLRTNIKIARVTGRILSTIYGPGNHPEETFVPNVQDIVQSLYWIAKEIPGDFSSRLFDLPSMEGDVSLRTSAYLHMMLYQAILLTIRPVMLHVSKLIFDDESSAKLSMRTSPLGRLSRTCSEAARRLLEVLLSLRKGNMLTIFGFFDLDAIFSAAFIMILTLVIDSTRNENERLAPCPGLSEALETLDYLVDRGNEFALQRAQEVRRMRDHLSAWLNIPKNSPSDVRSSHATTTSADRESQGKSNNNTSNSENLEKDAEMQPFTFPASTPRNIGENSLLTPSGRTSQLGSRSLLDSSLWNDISYLWLQPSSADDNQPFVQTNGMADLLPDDAYNCYSIYHNQNLTLTGQDLGDFEELERHIYGFGS